MRRTARHPGSALSQHARDVFVVAAGGKSQITLAKAKATLAKFEKSLIKAAQLQGGELAAGSPEVMKLKGTALSLWVSLRVIDDYEPFGNLFEQ